MEKLYLLINYLTVIVFISSYRYFINNTMPLDIIVIVTMGYICGTVITAALHTYNNNKVKKSEDVIAVQSEVKNTVPESIITNETFNNHSTNDNEELAEEHYSQYLMNDFSINLEEIREKLKGKKALVVDNNNISRKFLKEILGKFSISVKIEINENLCDSSFYLETDIVFVDYKLPFFTQCIEERNNSEKNKRVSVIVIIPATFSNKKDEYIQLGADACICKPYRQNEIYSSLKLVIAEKGM